MSAPQTLDDLTMIGTHLRLAREGWRDRLFLDEPPVERLLEELRDRGLRSGVLLCTCERVELLSEQPEAPRIFSDWLAAWAECDPKEMASALYRHEGRKALHHFARVAASLDSQVLGEPQVLGQVKEAERLSRALGLLTPLLDETCQTAFEAAKKVRSETAIGQRPVTIAAVALQVARDLHGDLRRCRLLLLGVGETIDLFRGCFGEAGLEDVRVTHPRNARGEAAARRLSAVLRPWDQLEAALADAEIVVTGLAGAGYSLEPPLIKRVLKARRHKPMLIIDGGVPGDVDPACNQLEDAFVYDLDDLERLAREGRGNRSDSLEEAEAIITGTLERLTERRNVRVAGGLMEDLEARIETLKRRAAESADGDAALDRLARDLRHGLSESLRRLAKEDPQEAAKAEGLLRRLFDLEGSGRKNGDGE